MYENMSTVNIRVLRKTRRALRDMGRKGETYDAILRRLIAHHAKTRPLDLGEAARKLPDIEKEAED